MNHQPSAWHFAWYSFRQSSVNCMEKHDTAGKCVYVQKPWGAHERASHWAGGRLHGNVVLALFHIINAIFGAIQTFKWNGFVLMWIVLLLLLLVLLRLRIKNCNSKHKFNSAVYRFIIYIVVSTEDSSPNSHGFCTCAHTYTPFELCNWNYEIIAILFHVSRMKFERQRASKRIYGRNMRTCEPSSHFKFIWKSSSMCCDSPYSYRLSSQTQRAN